MIKRTLQERLERKIDYKKAIIVLGPRQSGKTTLLTEIVSGLESNYLYINGDDPAIRTLWNSPDRAFIDQYTGSHKVVFIDEAQRLSNIGLSAKMIIDAGKKVQLFISGSSSLEFASTINEPLTGRKWEYVLYPIAWNEIKEHYSFDKAIRNLQNFLITGMYPEVVTHPENAREILTNLAGSYLYKDILEIGGVRKPDILIKLLQALAWQVGNEVSYNELAQTIGADKATVSSYIDLLEKSFVVFRLHPFARNLRNEINTSRKIFFYDNGVRNTVINNFAPLSQRNDVGALWENFLISERKKQLANKGLYTNIYFWRNTNRAEIDFIEEQDGTISAYEFKWNPKARARFPKSFISEYKPAITGMIHSENYWEWLGS